MSANILSKSFKILKEIDDVDLEEEDSANDFKTATRMPKPKSYIPPNRFWLQYLKISCIIVSILLILILLITISIYGLKNNETEVTNSTSPTTQSRQLPPLSQFFNSLIIVENNHTFWSVDPITSDFKVFHRILFDYTAYDLYPNKTMLWTEEKGLNVASLSNDFPNITFMTQCKVQAMAIDFITDKLYIVDKSAGTLSVIDLQRYYSGVILSTLNKPHDIVLDPMQGYMFIVQNLDSILRLDMDGTKPKIIREDHSVTAITINPTTGIIFWANEYGFIESSDYHGRSKFRIKASTGISSLAILNDKLFWLVSSNTTYNSSIFSCKIDNFEGTCTGKDAIIHVPFRTTVIKAFTGANYSVSSRNPCKIDNGRCSDLCLLNSESFSCTCKIGYARSTNSLKSCFPIEDFILYAQNNYFKGIILNDKDEASANAFYPTQFAVELLRSKETIDFDNGWLQEEVFFSDDKNIYKLNLNYGTQTKLFTESEGYIKDVAVDWFTWNVYYCVFKINLYDAYSIKILSIKSDKVFRKSTKLQHLGFAETTGYALHSLVIYPLKSVYFYNLYAKENIVMQGPLNGSNPTEYWRNYYLDKSELGILAIDYQEHALYRIEDEYWHEMTIKVLSYPMLLTNSLPHDDVNVTRYSLNLIIDKPKSASVFNDWLYISTPDAIWRVNKKTGANAKKIISATDNGISNVIQGLRVFSKRSMYPFTASTVAESECITDNDCDQFCFNDSFKKICSCQDGMTYNNGRCS